MGRGEFLELDDREQQQPEAGEPEVRDQDFYLRRGWEALRAAQPEPALKYFSRALERNINLEDAWTGQLVALLDLGNNDEAGTWAQRGLDHCPGSPAILALRATACIRQGFTDKAAGFLDAALKTRRNSFHTWLCRAELLAAEGSVKNAELSVQKALECGGEERFYVLRRAGEAFIIHNLAGLALPLFRETVALAPSRAVNHLRLAQALMLIGKSDEARKALDAARKLDPYLSEAARLAEKLDDETFTKRIWRRLRAWKG